MGKGGQKDSKNCGVDENEVLINGRCYDVTNLKHPGGNIIKYYAGKPIDATDAFNQFHIASKKAGKYLNSLPSRPADMSTFEANMLPGQKALLEDFHRFTQELTDEGYFKPSIPHIIYRFSEIILMHLLGFWLLFQGQQILGLVILGIVQGRCGWLMHEGGHYSLTGIIPIDKASQILLYGVGCGMSAAWWRNQHNKHHAMPQKLGHDIDLNTLPLVAFTKLVCKKCGMGQRSWLRLQAYLFPIITTTLVALGWQLFIHPRHILRSKNLSEAAALIARYALWTYLITMRFGLATSTWMYLFYTWVGANYIFINFAVSHTHLPTVPKDDVTVDWIRYAAVHTMNVKAGPLRFVDWWMSFLNYQIEHHLFPCMPQYRFPRISHRVKAFFERNGLVYDQRDYITAIKVTFANLDKVGKDVFIG